MGRKIYSRELKERVVSLAVQGRPIAQLAREYEPTEQTIHKWVLDSKKDSKQLAEELDTASEMRRLRRENKRLKEVNQILEKATAWFARGPRTQPGE